MPIVRQADAIFHVGHRLDDGIFNEVSIQLAIQEHILNGSRYVLIFRTFHKSIFVKVMTSVMGVTEDNVAILLIGINLGTNINLVSYAFANANPVALHSSAAVHKPLFLIRCINKAKHSLPLAAAKKNAICPQLCFHFVYNVRVAIAKIEFLE